MENTQSASPLTAPSATSTTQSSSSLLIGLLVGVTVGGLVAGGTGYFLGRRSVVAGPIPSATSTSASPAVSPETSTDVENGGETTEKAAMLTYLSKEYPYQLGYPSHFKMDAHNLTRGEGRTLTTEQVSFENQNAVAAIRSFSIRVAPGKADGLYLDTEATDTTKIGENVFNYFSLPEGYQDGPPTAQPPLPIIAFEIERDGMLYVIDFSGASELDDPFVQMIMESFKFTD
jgi:hypothetical protein